MGEWWLGLPTTGLYLAHLHASSLPFSWPTLEDFLLFYGISVFFRPTQKIGWEGPKWGREGLLNPANKNLADILGRTDRLIHRSYWIGPCSDRFLHSAKEMKPSLHDAHQKMHLDPCQLATEAPNGFRVLQRIPKFMQIMNIALQWVQRTRIVILGLDKAISTRLASKPGLNSESLLEKHAISTRSWTT